MVSNQAHDVAVITDQIAKLVVSDANTKEFKGKSEVKAKALNVSKATHSSPTQTTTVSKKSTTAPKTVKTEATKVVASKPAKEDDEWESF